VDAWRSRECRWKVMFCLARWMSISTPAKRQLPAVLGQQAAAAVATEASLMAKLSCAIRSLLASSLGLPGMQELLAQDAPDDEVSYRFTHYDEDPLPLDKLAFGDPRRYEIQSHQFRIVKNLDETYGLELNYQHEAMSGSSPWYVLPDSSGPLQVMSGATIRENRDQVDVAIARRKNDFTHRGAIGYSTEDDYEALYASYSGEKDSEDGLRTISWGASYSDDEITPTDALMFDRIPYAERDSFSGSLALTQVLNRNAVIQSGVSLTRQSGFLSDPYKQVWIDRAVLNDSRPDRRVMFAWTTRFRQFMERSKAALTLNYRFFRDDWEITAHTLDAAWRQPLGNHWEIAPSIRYYSQKSPDFYAPFYFELPADGYWSSDYRLATYGALSYRLNVTYRQERWSLSFGGEYYNSRESLAISGTPEDTPALVDFWHITAGFKVTL
jgi:hypothetical protein